MRLIWIWTPLDAKRKLCCCFEEFNELVVAGIFESNAIDNETDAHGYLSAIFDLYNQPSGR